MLCDLAFNNLITDLYKFIGPIIEILPYMLKMVKESL